MGERRAAEDASPALALHPLGSVVARVVGAVDVAREDFAPVLGRTEVDREAARHAGVVHEDVDAAEGVLAALDQLTREVEVLNGADTGDRAAACRLDLGHDGFGLLPARAGPLRSLAASVHDDAGSLAREGQRDR